MCLANPDQLQCGHCHYVGPPRPETREALWRAAHALQHITARERQLTSLQRSYLSSRWPTILFVGTLLFFTLPFMGFEACCIAGGEPGWAIAAGMLPLVVMGFSGWLGLWWIGRQRRKLELACAAVPPRTPGEPAMCHVCGGPLDNPQGKAIVRCGYCHADNAVGAEVLQRMGAQQQVVVGHYEEAVRKQGRSLARTGLLANVLVFVGALLAPIVATIGSLFMMLTMQQIDTEPNLNARYVLTKTDDGTCLSEVVKEDGKSLMVWGTYEPRGMQKQYPYPAPGMNHEMLTPQQLVGKRFFAAGAAGTVKSVHATASDTSLNFLAVDIAGTEERVPARNACLDDGAPAQLLAANVGMQGFTLSGDQIIYSSTDSVRTQAAAGGQETSVTSGLSDVARKVAANRSHVFVSLGIHQKLARIPKPSGKPELLKIEAKDLVSAMIATDDVLFVARDSGLQRIDLQSLQPQQLHDKDVDALALEGKLLAFVSEEAVYRIQLPADDAQRVATGASVDTVAIHDGQIYWLAGRKVMRFAGGESSEVFELGEPFEKAKQLLVDDSHIYIWVEGGQTARNRGGLFRRSHKGTELEPLAIGISYANQVAQDDKAVYWVDNYQRRLMRQAK